MLAASADELDTLTREEKGRVALEFFQDAWNQSVQEGIEGAIIAESAIVAALSELHRREGEAAVARIIDALPDRVEAGDFDPDRVLQ